MTWGQWKQQARVFDEEEDNGGLTTGRRKEWKGKQQTGCELTGERRPGGA